MRIPGPFRNPPPHRSDRTMRLSNRSLPGLPARTLDRAVTLLLLGWTILWAVQALMGIRADTALGRGEVAGPLAFHQLWEVTFVAAFYMIRWAAGATLIALPLLVSRVAVRVGWGRRRAGAVSS